MDTIILGIFGGILLGLASSLHCAAMCCGISTSLMFMFDTRTPGARARVLTLANAGRAISYMSMGAALGAMGSGLVGQLPSPLAFKALQFAGAVALMWIGLSTAGLLPSIAIADRLIAPLSAPIGRSAHRLAASPLGPLAMGLAWGFMPCAMVYGALLTALLTGTAIGGAAVMGGFAAGTLPALAIASFGLKTLAINARGRVRTATGIAIAVAGFGSMYAAPAIADFICR